MFVMRVDDTAVRNMLDAFPAKAMRAAEQALDATAREIKKEVSGEMRKVFDRPVPYTLNSLQMTPTRNHNLQASVWFKDPDRMREHYLIPQVEGGQRKLKGFERWLGDDEYVPGHGAKMDRYGNISTGQIRQVMSVIGKAQMVAGFSANITDRSKKRNTKQRDYVYLPSGSKGGALPPGVYQRVAMSRAVQGRYSTISDRRKHRTGWQAQQVGNRSAVISARGLSAIMVHGKTGDAVRPRLRFYEIANKTFSRSFTKLFWSRFKL